MCSRPSEPLHSFGRIHIPTSFYSPPAELCVRLLLLMLSQLLLQVPSLKMGQGLCAPVGGSVKVFTLYVFIFLGFVSVKLLRRKKKQLVLQEREGKMENKSYSKKALKPTCNLYTLHVFWVRGRNCEERWWNDYEHYAVVIGYIMSYFRIYNYKIVHIWWGECTSSWKSI